MRFVIVRPLVAVNVACWPPLVAFLQWGQGFDPVEGAVVGVPIGVAFGLYCSWLDRWLR